MNQDDRIEAYLQGAISAEHLTDEDVLAMQELVMQAIIDKQYQDNSLVFSDMETPVVH
jgi:hypothetical protein